ncbi:hypothetical protein VHUM_01491 [Vanrija humicola]|uniref:Transcription initiation factor IIF subunit beta n=1 Tax=Vanrija humicola TaxID=5417 RepID=A0A7D8Z2K7_VANHU|nr:hypothetical protein VHUM_01491 [Vanrija humicola]
MSQSEDIKPLVTVNGHDVFNLPVVEEEELDVSPTLADSKVWAIKVPRFLLERWERVEQAGVLLGTLNVDNSKNPPYITLKLPVEEETEEDTKRTKLDTNGIPDEFQVILNAERVKNTFIFTEKERTWVAQGGGESSSTKRKREKAHPRLLASLDHEGSVRPIRSAKYLKILEQRRLENEQSKRPIVQLDDTKMSQAKLNQLASGFSNASSTLGKGMVERASRVAPGERYARLERGELTDRLFALFSEKPYWSITALKATLQQPDAWLREVLKEVAVLIKEGQYANMWELKDNWKEAGKSEPGVKGEEDDDEEDDDDDEDDFEVVEG